MTLTSWKPIADQALMRLGSKPLPTTTWPPTGDSKQEEAVYRFWDQTLEEVAGDHAWPNLVNSLRLVKGTPTAGTYLEHESATVFSLAAAKSANPPLVRVLTVYPQQPWRVEGSLLILENGDTVTYDNAGTNEESVWVRAVYLPAAPSTGSPLTIDAMLYDALSLALAANMAPLMQPNRPDMEAKLLNLLDRKLAQARSRDGRNTTDRERELYAKTPEIWGQR